ncbi:MAG: ricin-type beta-trefoil lectin domain protein, partial [Actinocrinis sp.]
TSSTSVPNVAWINPDGSKALVAYNQSGSTQTVHVNWGGETFGYSLPAQTSATFTWAGTQGSGGGGGSAGPGQVTGYQGLCLDDRSASTANLNPVQVYTCNGTSAQSWTLTSTGQLQTLGKCLDVNAAGTANGTTVDLYDCNGTAAQTWQHQSNGEYLNPNSGKCLDDTGFGGSGTQAQIWSCGGTSNQQWSLP